MSDDVSKNVTGSAGSPKLPSSMLLNKITSPSARSPSLEIARSPTIKPVIKRNIKVNNDLQSPAKLISPPKPPIDLDSIVIEKTVDVKSPSKSPLSTVPPSKLMGKTVVSPSGIKNISTSPQREAGSPTIVPSLLASLPKATITSVRKKLEEIPSSASSVSSSGSSNLSSTRSSRPPSTTLTHRKIIQPVEETKMTSMPFSLDAINSPRDDRDGNIRIEMDDNVVSSVRTVKSSKETPRGKLLADEPEVQIEDEEEVAINSALKNKTETPIRRVDDSRKFSSISQPQETSRQVVSNVKNNTYGKEEKIYSPKKNTETSNEELTEEEERILLLARFKILKKSWPEIPVPEHDNISVKQLKKVYELYKARIFAEECAGGYKKYLIALFVIIEVITVRFLGLNMDGFTINQLNSMNTYQDLLIELADKYGEQTQSQFSVETRLMFAVGMNAVIFFGLKYVFGDVNPETSKMIANALGGKGDTTGMSGLLGGLVSTLSGSGSSKSESGGLGPPPNRRRRKEG